jgi:hypothetical protein
MLSMYPMMEALSPNLKKAAKIGAGVAGAVGAGIAAYKNKDDIGKGLGKIKSVFTKAADQSDNQAAENNTQGSKFKLGTEEKRLASRQDKLKAEQDKQRARALKQSDNQAAENNEERIRAHEDNKWKKEKALKQSDAQAKQNNEERILTYNKYDPDVKKDKILKSKREDAKKLLKPIWGNRKE